MQSSYTPTKIPFKSFSYPVESFHKFCSKDGQSKLHSYRYPAHFHAQEKKAPKASVILFHGFGSYIGSYAYLAKDFSDAGYDFVGFDYKGFGRSEGHRGLIDSDEQFIGDGLEFVEFLKGFYKQEYPDTPIPLVGMGISLGGNCVISLLRQHFSLTQSFLFDSLLLVVPGLQTDEPIPPAVREQVRTVAKTSPASEIMPFTRSEEEHLKEFMDDPLYYTGGALAATLDTVQKLYEDNFEFAEKIKVPIHTTGGKSDHLVTLSSIKAFVERTSSEKKVVEECESNHYLLMDGHWKDLVVAKQLQFLKELGL